MTRWGMVIDLTRCVSCYGCVIACKQEHFIPPDIFWNRLLISDIGEYPDANRFVYPVLCNHCKDPICVRVCPTGATIRREDGIITIDSDKCVGCQYCVVACPYQQRTFYVDDRKGYFPGQALTELEAIGRKLYSNRPDTVIKCTFCVERIDEGLQRGLKPGIDHEATPACVNTCPAKARSFGDMDNPYSNVSMLIRKRKGYQLHPHLGTDPSVYYID
ncbi:MAG: 4Fe-4S ferredoxin [Deltaproteobacteria bacterium RBG_13_47_9]|nr:MAG: 4Fe-4S ferredoxin [Deltaproteobacteria bacterium RBG_13_47_9]